MVKVYFELGGYAKHIATFQSEEAYIRCLASLETLAKENGFETVTESVES